MKAFLNTYQGETLIQKKLVEIHDAHDFAQGPYQDTVPLSVGSNQSITPAEESEVAAHAAWATQIEERFSNPEAFFLYDGDLVRAAPYAENGQIKWEVATANGTSLETGFPSEEYAKRFIKTIGWPEIQIEIPNPICAYALVTDDGFRRVGGCKPGELAGILKNHPQPITELVTEIIPKKDFDTWRDKHDLQPTR